MVDLSKDPTFLVNHLSVMKVVEGLIHNINTPLNIIIGYSQHLKKQYPDLDTLDKIKQAGLQIDDLLQSCFRALTQQINIFNSEIELNSWLTDEIAFLKNYLDLKHSLKINVIPEPRPLLVKTNPFLLSIFFQCLMFYVKACDSTSLSITIGIKLIIKDNYTSMEIEFPQHQSNFELNNFLQEIKSYIKLKFNVSEMPFSMKEINSNILELVFLKTTNAHQ